MTSTAARYTLQGPPMSRPTFTRVHDLDAAVQEVFGVTEREFRKARRVNHLPNAIFNRVVSLIEPSGAIDLIDKWDREDRKSPAGRNPLVSPLAVLVVFLLSAFRSKAYSFEEGAETIATRLTREQLERLGIAPRDWDAEDWYQPLWRAMRRLRRMIDPWHHSGLGHKLDGASFFQAGDLYDHAREERAHELADRIIRATIDMLPKRYLEHYPGDVALDSAAFKVRGPRNHFNEEKIKKFGKRNVDFQCGLYSRETIDHSGAEVVKTFDLDPAYEADTTVLADAKRGDWAFTLITGYYLHLPGQLGHGPRRTVEQHVRFTKKRGLMLVDHAFNNLKAHRFQEPIRRFGFEAAYTYRDNQLGVNGHDPNNPYVIIVDGTPYVNRMREEARQISRLHAMKANNPVTGKPYTLGERNEIMATREPYRLKAITGIDADGYQRFRYPDPSTYLAFDPATGKPTEDVPRQKTVRFNLAPELIRHLQKYPWQSEVWKDIYGQRNQVESSNKILKDRSGPNLGDRGNRQSRGFAFTYLITMLGAASANITRIVAGIKKLAKQTADLSPTKQRPRHRTDGEGKPLPRQEPVIAKPDTGDPPGINSRE